MRFLYYSLSALAAALLICAPCDAQTRRDTRPSPSNRTSTQTSGRSSTTRPTSAGKSSSTSRPSSVGRPSGSTSSNSSSVKQTGSYTRQTAPQVRRPSNAQQSQNATRRPSSEVDRPSTSNGNGVKPSAQTRPGRRPSPNQDRYPSSNQDKRPQVKPSDRNPQPGGAPPRHPQEVRPENRPSHVPPHDRGPVSYRQPSKFYDCGHHYYGYRVHRLPHDYSVYVHWGHRYYVCDGVYYRLFDGAYYVCRPPYGYYFSPTVYAYSPVAIDFAYYNLAYRQYNIINDNYSTIAEQNRIIAQNNALISSQNAAIQQNAAINNRLSDESYILARQLGLVQSYASLDVKYYYDDGVFFVTNSRGEYETIVPPAGAVVDSMPDDYEMVTLSDGKEYYLVDDTVYRVIVRDGKAMFEVLGQIQK